MKTKRSFGKIEDDDILFIIAEVIGNTGYWLKTNPRDNARKLRLMQQIIKDVTQSTFNRHIIFLKHFLNSYVNQLWNNFAVDFTKESGNPGKNILDEMLRNIGKTLIDLSIFIKEGNIERCYQAVSELVLEYGNAVQKVHEKRKEIEEIKFDLGKLENPEMAIHEKMDLYEVLNDSGIITKSEYTLAGGSPSNYFFDIDKIYSNPHFIDVVSDFYAKEIDMIKAEIDKLAFIEKDVGTIGALPLMSSILIKTKMPAFIVRLTKVVPIGRIKYSMNMKPKKDERVAIISDVATTSKGILEAARIIQEIGAKPLYAIVLFDRGQGAAKILEKEGIKLRAILSRDELVRLGFISSTLDPNFEREEENVIPPPKL